MPVISILGEVPFPPGNPRVLLLRARRESDGSRTCRLPAGALLPTSYGEDTCLETFGVRGEATLR